MIRVLIADDHAVVREGIKRIIADLDDMEVVAEAADGAELLAAVTTSSWDVTLMDLAMPGLSGLELVEGLRRRAPQRPILILSMYPEDQYAVRALRAGAAGYIYKGNPPDEVIKAIRMVASGRRYITPEVAEHLAAHVDVAAEKLPHECLSNREHQVLCLMGSGKAVGEIADELGLSVKTVSTYRAHLLEKLGLRNSAEIIRYAIEHKLVD
ncbi:MAG: response regulator transcription factor [Planctomycetes bacterium]|nr:response regulator transcription factor [Planctomycetota bacterium]